MFRSLLFVLLLGVVGEAVLFNDTAGLFKDWSTGTVNENLAVSGGLEGESSRPPETASFSLTVPVLQSSNNPAVSLNNTASPITPNRNTKSKERNMMSPPAFPILVRRKKDKLTVLKIGDNEDGQTLGNWGKLM